MTNLDARRQTLITLLLLAAASSPAHSRVWEVQRDGTADFSTIQPAIDAAAEGDTILLGPGRYTEFAPFDTNPIVDTYAAVTVDNLTILGQERDTVIIGPEVPDFQGLNPRGIATGIGINGTTIVNLTLENLRDGANLSGNCYVERLRIADCRNGLSIGTAPFVEGRSLVITGSTADGVFTANGTTAISFYDCFLEDNGVGFSFNRTGLATVVNCSVQGGGLGLSVGEGTTGVVSSCTFVGQESGGVFATVDCDLTLSDCRIENTAFGIWVRTRSILRGSGNQIRNTSFATMRFWTNATADFHHNDLLKGDGPLIKTDGYVGDPVDIDLTNNYWGTVDAAQISAWIEDGNDPHHPVLDPNFSNVLFEPFLTWSVPVNRQSFGRLKAQFEPERD